MKKPDTPSEEKERIDNLKSYQLLDTEFEPDYDYITELASQICETPIALISIIDEQRQWFKSRVGLDAPETSREVSFCGHAINGEDLLEVKDSTKDERFADNPLVTDAPHVIFYAGQPIISKEGFKLGTLCVIDNKPNELSDDQKRTLKILSHHVTSLLETRKSNFKLKEALAEVELKTSEMIHNSKLVGLGRLAGGIAHEINNPLTIVGGRVEQLMLLLKGYEEDSKEKKLLNSLKDGVRRIKGIVVGMLEFSRDENSSAKTNTSFSECFDTIYPFFKEKSKSIGLNLNVDIEDGLDIHVNKVQVSQIIVNLLNNAIDATENGQYRKINISMKKENEYAICSIADNGPGIPSDKIDQVLEPFFTTKDPGKGTGLGLSISFGLAAKNDGELYINKTYENGAEFILKFPLL